MKEFVFYSPTSVPAALELLAAHKEEKPCIVAGGTDIVIELNERKHRPGVVVDIKRLKELEYIRFADGLVHIGALTSHAAIAADPRLAERTKVLQRACASVGSPQIRNLGTIGGNLSTSSVAGDGVAALTALDASVVLERKGGKRVMKLTEFLAGEGYDKRNALEADELLTEVFFTEPDARTATAFYKLAKRKSLAISVIGGAMVCQLDEAGKIKHVSLRGGCLGRYPLQFRDAEEYLIGKPFSLELLQETLPMMHDLVLELNRSRPWSVFYKKESVQGVFRKLFAEVTTQLCPEAA